MTISADAAEAADVLDHLADDPAGPRTTAFQKGWLHGVAATLRGASMAPLVGGALAPRGDTDTSRRWTPGGNDDRV